MKRIFFLFLIFSSLISFSQEKKKIVYTAEYQDADEEKYPLNELVVFNQWGDEVYRSGQPYASDWDGTFQGDPLPVGTYFFTIEFGDGRDTATGHVRVQR